MNSDKTTFKKIRKVLEFVWSSPYSSFYKNKYKKAGINLLKDINSLEDFKKLPYLTKDEMLSVGPYERFYMPPNKAERMVMTSGTSTNGSSPLISLRTRSHPLLYKNHHKQTVEHHARVGMVMRNAFNSQNRLLVEDKMFVMLGDITNLSVSAKMAAQLKVDALYSTATILYFFLPYLKKEYDPLKIKFINLGGEYCSEQKAAFLKKSFPNAYFSFRYGCTEAEQIAKRCDFLYKEPPRFFHPLPLLYFESRNPGDDDELILTHLHTTISFPLIRYRTGDCVKITETECECGNNQKLEVLGRLGYDLFKVHGTAIHVDSVAKAIEPYAKYLSSLEWQLHVFEITKNNAILPLLQLHLLAKKSKDITRVKKLLETGISKNFYLSSKTTLSELVEKGVFLPLEIKFIEEFPLLPKKKHIISHLI